MSLPFVVYLYKTLTCVVYLYMTLPCVGPYQFGPNHLRIDSFEKNNRTYLCISVHPGGQN